MRVEHRDDPTVLPKLALAGQLHFASLEQGFGIVRRRDIVRVGEFADAVDAIESVLSHHRDPPKVDSAFTPFPVRKEIQSFVYRATVEPSLFLMLAPRPS